ncbi:MAG: excinuclease ABC subunit UvrC [Hydrogenothermaceae bacterium]|nr:excinuclease ABC subunit UvrC [Hydrogenothermaceae bacterium]
MKSDFSWALEYIDKAPESPGVYIFRNKDKFLYIGKAVNIKNRLRGHYNLIKDDPKEKKIFSESKSIEWIVTKSEYEAFILENEMIKLHKPKYNVMLKSGSGYPMIVITDEEYPTIKISRKFGEIKGEYFGPFLPAKNARALKDLIHKLFKLRTCDPLPVRNMVCFDYHLGLCSGPCANKITKKDYQSDAQVAKAFLSGNVKNVIYKLYDRLKEYSEKLMFEKAAVVRDQIKALETVVKKQEVVGLDIEEADVFYITSTDIYLIVVRGHTIVGKEKLNISDRVNNELVNVVMEYYDRGNYIPQTIMVNKTIDEEEFLIRWLKEFKKRDVNLSCTLPKQILNFIERNISDVDLTVVSKIFEDVFGFKLPSRIECFDISHLQGVFTVGSCVVWENGSMNKREYRRYRVKTVDYIDDYSSLREVLTRRFSKYKDLPNPPEVVLIDGGKGQLSIGVEVKNKLGLADLKIFSIAKKEEIIFTEDGQEVHLFDYQPLLKLFTSIRDEAHRFALSYNRKLREKHTLKSVLDDIKGIGEKRKELLYRSYKTVDNILKASDEELNKLGIPVKLSQKIKRYLKGEKVD